QRALQAMVSHSRLRAGCQSPSKRNLSLFSRVPRGAGNPDVEYSRGREAHPSESQAKVHGEGYRTAAGTACRSIKADRKVGLGKIGFKEATLAPSDRPAFGHQRRESKLRRIDIECGSPPNCETVPDSPDHTGMDGEANAPRSILY